MAAIRYLEVSGAVADRIAGAGKAAILLGTAIIFASAALEGQLPQPWFADLGSGTGNGAISGLVAAIAVVALGQKAIAQKAALIVTVFWIAAASFALSGILWTGPSVGKLVPMLEAAVLAVACLVLAIGRSTQMLRTFLAVMLMVFGSVHLLSRDAIAQLIPEFMPWRAMWPWLTGSLQLAAGLAGLTVASIQTGFLLIAAMYLSWLPLVHIPRLMEDFSTGEVTFAAMALALAGCLAVSLVQVGREANRRGA